MKQTAYAITPASDFDSLRREMLDSLREGDLSEAMAECSKLADKAFGRNFAAAAGPHSGPWPERKKKGGGIKRGDGHPLEIKTGDMFQAVTSPFGRGHIEDVFGRGADLGVNPSDIPYAAAQNYGRPEANLPQREFEDVTDEDANQMTEIVADAMQELLLE